MHNYRLLDVWQRSRRLVLDVYRATSSFPADERFGLCRQIRRAVVSVPSNIAEGAGRGSPREFARFIRMALGSACEIETQLDLSHDLQFLPAATYQVLTEELEEIKKMLRALERKVIEGS